ncbi:MULTISPECIES: ABC transporter substrate-binding protein [unclassified Isoptericola]|uniref:ABC transporter substrate-binding protein n=1 Tax=unclassified Isoptericola TaxID=2623355 RepID=UPI00271244E2|nr:MULTISPECIES: ABC transporter substrate-binding protein [unclassified Isoptericola]MDO8143649.1 ABC transporter substrate-binding protein [Isoptericola sp. 178]MDO8147547.1 ABC transporter substrate-binding protein [Isoptericola sp. b515]MDO8150153.1 ABC transporter substrate-binding protein [Isoptericola sp. b408]
MTRRMTAAKGLALAAALSLGLTACGSDDSADEAADTSEESMDEGSADPLTIGTILPVTGTLSFLGPPEIAGVGLAIQDINEAGGVLGSDVEVEWGDSGDNTDLTVANSTATDLISKGADAVIGAASSSVSLGVVDVFAEAQVMQISPANTAADLSGYGDFYTRTAPPDTVQGAALGSLILDGGHQDVAMIVLNDAYGTGLRDHTQSAIEAGGGTVVYGANGAGEEFPPGETNFGSQVSAALGTDPDALVVIAFEETVAAVNELVAQGWDFDGTTYFTDGNLSDWSGDFDEGTLAGVQGTLPGAQAEDDFKERLNTWHEENEGSSLDGYSYAAESYDATILAALAAVRGEGTDGVTISENIAAVSGAEGGTEVTTFAEGVEALEAGEEIDYTGPSGTGPLNEDNDPSSAFIGIYEYGDDNTYTYVRQIEGQIGG